jgi:hypothetical protein
MVLILFLVQLLQQEADEVGSVKGLPLQIMWALMEVPVVAQQRTIQR